jgi:hypothetical protein
MLGELRDVFAVDKAVSASPSVSSLTCPVVGQGFPDLAPMARRSHHDDALGRRALPERGAKRAVYF